MRHSHPSYDIIPYTLHSVRDRYFREVLHIFAGATPRYRVLNP